MNFSGTECVNCNSGTLEQTRTNNYIDGFCWQCRNRNCRKRLSPKKGSWFENSKLDYKEILLITYCWAIGHPNWIAAHECDISEKTIVEWYNFCRNTCALCLDNQQLLYEKRPPHYYYKNVLPSSYQSEMEFRQKHFSSKGKEFLTFLRSGISKVFTITRALSISKKMKKRPHHLGSAECLASSKKSRCIEATARSLLNKISINDVDIKDKRVLIRLVKTFKYVF